MSYWYLLPRNYHLILSNMLQNKLFQFCVLCSPAAALTPFQAACENYYCLDGGCYSLVHKPFLARTEAPSKQSAAVQSCERMAGPTTSNLLNQIGLKPELMGKQEYEGR